jgi:hypothetical protein
MLSSNPGLNQTHVLSSPEFLRFTQRCILGCVRASLGEFFSTFRRKVPSSRKNAFFLEIKVDEECILPGD